MLHWVSLSTRLSPVILTFCFSLHQVQNMTQSIQNLDQRTQKDLQYVQRMEVQLRGLETKFKQVEESHKQNIAKQYKVLTDTCSTIHNHAVNLFGYFNQFQTLCVTVKLFQISCACYYLPLYYLINSCAMSKEKY